MTENVKISNIEFSADEWAQICALAQRKNKKAQLLTAELLEDTTELLQLNPIANIAN